VGGEVVGAIDGGLMVLLGVASGDGEDDAVALADKLVALRVFRDDAGKMNRSVAEVDGAILVISQFTLHADLKRGRRPSFVEAAPPEVAEPLVTAIVDRLRAHAVPVATGSFGAMMEVDLINDGPVTLVIDVREGRVV
jgi:D-tyrosyl-tRNA(Tyr) deacylase